MLYTASFFSKSDHYGDLGSIANSAPAAFGYLSRIEMFVPEWSIVKAFKDGKISWNRYEQDYLSGLKNKAHSECLETLRVMPKAIPSTLQCFAGKSHLLAAIARWWQIGLRHIMTWK